MDNQVSIPTNMPCGSAKENSNAPTPSASAKKGPPLRWYQFRLRSLLLFVTLCCVALSIYKTWFASRIVILNDDNFDQIVHRSSGNVVVEFYMDASSPCTAMNPTMERLAWDFRNGAKAGIVDVRASPQLVKRFGVTAVPLFLIFQNGKCVDQIMGGTTIKRLRKFIPPEKDAESDK